MAILRPFDALQRKSSLQIADLWLLLCVLIWSLNISLVKVSLRYFQPLTISAIRVAIAFGVFAVVVLVRERSVSIERRDILRMIAAAFSGIFLNQLFFSLAVHSSKASTVALLLGVIPVFVAIIAASLGIERLTSRLIFGVGFSVVGVILIIETQPGVSHTVGTLQGALLALGASLSWAVYTLLLQPLLTRYSVARISFWATGLGIIGLLPVLIVAGPLTKAGNIPFWAWLLVVFSGLGAIALTNFLWYTGTFKLGPSRGSLYAFLQPFVGALLAVAILGDKIGVAELFGGVLVLIGISVGRGQRVVPAGADLAIADIEERDIKGNEGEFSRTPSA